MPTIAYIAPELTSRSEAFVCQELEAIEAMGYRVLPFAVRQTGYPAPEAREVARRTIVLRSGALWSQLTAGVAGALGLGVGVAASLGMLLSDWRHVGLASRRGWSLVRDWLAAAQMGPVLVASGVAHIHAHFAGRPTQIAMYAAAMTGIAFTCTVHASDTRRRCRLLRRKAERARKLLTVSSRDRACLEQAGIEPARIEVVRSTALADPASPSQNHRCGGPYRIGASFGRNRNHGLDDLVQALALMVRDGCAPLRLLVAGDGTDRLRLEVLAERLGVGSLVDFVGPIEHAQRSYWLRSLDLFVGAPGTEPTRDVDSVPDGLLDAMSLGVPVVSTCVSGLGELVIDGRTGYLAEPANPRSLASKILCAMAEPQRAHSLGQAARAHARWEFGRTVNLRRLARHFGATTAPMRRVSALERAA